MNLTKKTWLLIALVAFGGILLLLGISELVEYSTGMKPGETYAPEETVAVDGHTLHYSAGMSSEDFSAGTPAGDWIIGCSAPDRNDHFDAYILRHDATEGDMTTYTYLVYIPGATSDTAAPALFDGATYGYRIDLYRTEPVEGGYTLSRVQVTLPTTEEAPRLRIIVDDDALGALVTVTETPIPGGG